MRSETIVMPAVIRNAFGKKKLGKIVCAHEPSRLLMHKAARNHYYLLRKGSIISEPITEPKVTTNKKSKCSF